MQCYSNNISSSSQYIYSYYVPVHSLLFFAHLNIIYINFWIVLFVCLCFFSIFFPISHTKISSFLPIVFVFMYFLFIFWAVWKDKNMNVSTCKSDFHLLLVLNNCFIIKSNLNTTNTCH